MQNQLKIVLYIAAAVGVVALFFNALRPYLLQSPPNSFALAAVGLIFGLMLWAVVYGPVIILRLRATDRYFATKLLNHAFWSFAVGAVLGLMPKSVPVITPISFACFALIVLMLRVSLMHSIWERRSA